ncbi:MAG: 4Fe-4S dicluster domain-containing protein [Candidatus Hodarchaeales archaeon]|jgi:heterodisulfide reductase subunit C
MSYERILPSDDPLVKSIQKETQVCFQCKTCTSICPVFRIKSDFKPAEIAQQLTLNGSVPIIDELPAYWLCAGCYSCETICPQHVDLTHIFFKLKNWALNNGEIAPPGLVTEGNTMYKGITTNISQSILNRRESMKLPDIPKGNTNELERILEATKFKEKLKSETKIPIYNFQQSDS